MDVAPEGCYRILAAPLFGEARIYDVLATDSSSSMPEAKVCTVESR